MKATMGLKKMYRKCELARVWLGGGRTLAGMTLGTGLGVPWRRKNSGWDDHVLGTGQGVARRRKNSGWDDHVLGTGQGVVRWRKNEELWLG